MNDFENQLSRETAPPAVIFTRGGRIESLHRAHACIATSEGEVVFALGDPDYSAFLRSSSKPLQALNAVLTGAVDKYGITPRELAVIAGSHGGESIHIEAVVSILSKAGLTPDHLQCGIQQPLDSEMQKTLAEAGEQPTVLHHNCSGKHTGMLIAAKYLGLSPEDYLNTEHPVQREITGVLARMAGVEAGEIANGIDGCSAPVHALPMRAAARAFARMVQPEGLPSDLKRVSDRVVEAMRAHPEMVAASRGRICTELIRNISNNKFIAKAGAEGYYAAGWVEPKSGKGIGLAMKIEDGAQRARDPLLIALLQRSRILPDELPPALIPFAAGPILNFKGLIVGDIVVVGVRQ